MEKLEQYQSELGEKAIKIVLERWYALTLKKVLEVKDTRTPDYEVLNSAGEVIAICEVKSCVDANVPTYNPEISYEELAANPDLMLLGGAVNSGSAQSAGGVTTDFTQYLSFGSSGAQVSALQQVLYDDGDYQADIVSGFFGRLTQQAVQVFQCLQGIVCSGAPDTTGYGAVGPRTRTALGL